MKEKHPIDDLFKDKLHDFSLESPMHLWDKIATATTSPEPTKRRIAGWYWLLSAGILFLAIGIWFWNPFSKTNIDLDHFPIALEQQNVRPSTTTLETISNEAPIMANVETISIDQATKTSTSNIPQEARLAESISEAPSSELQNIISTSENSTNNSLESQMSESDSKVADLVIDESMEVSGYTQNEEETSVPFEMALLAPKNFLLEVPNMDGPLECARFQKKVWSTTAGFMASMDYAIRQVEAKDSDFSGYAKLRNDTETFRHGFSVGMRFSTISETGFAVRSGLNYSQINEQLNFKIKEEEQLTVTTKYDTDGSIIGADTSINLIETFKIVNNRYTELDIPLLVGYEIIGDKFSFSVNGGAFINMLASQKGEFVSPNTNQPVSFASNDPNAYRAFKNRIGIGLYGSMGFYFQFGEDMQVLFEPYVKWRPGSISAEGYIVDQRYLTTGLFVGLRKNIL